MMDIRFTWNLIVAAVALAVIFSYSPRVTDNEGFNWRDHMVYSWSTAALVEDMDMETRQGKE